MKDLNKTTLEVSPVTKGFLDEFMGYFSVTSLFLRPRSTSKFPIDPLQSVEKKSEKEGARSKSLPLSSVHFNLLWMIKTLADESGKEVKSIEGIRPSVDLTTLRRVFFWYTDNKIENKDHLKNLLAVLRRTGHISFVRDREFHYFLTRKGIRLFKENRKRRIGRLDRFFIKSELSPKQCQALLLKAREISANLWAEILQQSLDIPIPKESKKN